MSQIIGIPKQNARIMSIDPACSAKDATTICLREGDELLDWQSYTGISLNDAVKCASRAVFEHKPDIVVIDNAGAGREFEELLRRVIS